MALDTLSDGEKEVAATAFRWLVTSSGTKIALTASELAEAASGAKVPHLLKSARRAGLLDPELLEALHLSNQPLIRGALRGGAEPTATHD